MPYTASLNGVTIGDGTAYRFEKAPAGRGVIARRSARVPKVAGGTQAAGRDVPETTDLIFDVFIVGATEPEVIALEDVLLAAWAPRDGIVELTLDIAGVSRSRRGRPVVCAVDDTWVRQGELANAHLVFDPLDPLWYGPGYSVNVATAGVITGGFVSPFVSPFVSTGSGSLGDKTVINYGTAPADWTAQIIGPVTTPRLILNGVTIEVSGVIDAGSIAYVDSRERTVTVDGAIRPWVSHTSTWWKIPPGASTFSFRASAGTGSATLSWRDTFY